MVNAPGPTPSTPGSGTEFSPRQLLQPANVTAMTAMAAATRIHLARIMIRLPAAPSSQSGRQQGWWRQPPLLAAEVRAGAVARHLPAATPHLRAVAAECNPGASNP